MKTLDEYMAMSYRIEIVEDQDEGGFVLSYPDLPGCITCGETIETAITNAQDAKREWFQAALEENDVLFSDRAWQDYLYWQTQDKKTLRKINELIKDIERNGISTGIGKPEPQKYRNVWSRRMDEKID